jgi:hypothetical protein
VEKQADTIKSTPKQTKQANRADIVEKLSKVGVVNDQEMSRENIQKLISMSKEEVEQEQQDLMKVFSSKQLSILKRLGQSKQEKVQDQNKNELEKEKVMLPVKKSPATQIPEQSREQDEDDETLLIEKLK